MDEKRIEELIKKAKSIYEKEKKPISKEEMLEIIKNENLEEYGLKVRI